MPTYLVSPPEQTDWREDPEDFAVALLQRWPDARTREDPPQSTMALTFEFEEDGEPVQGSLHRDGQAQSLSADLPLATKIATWWRERVPGDVPLIFYDEAFNASAPVQDGMDATAVMDAYLAAASG